MALKLQSQLVWEEIGQQLFCVLGMVSAAGEARTVGVVYLVQDHKLYIGTGMKTWKARHIAANPAVSITIPIPKRVPLLPWIKIPQATITFAGRARVFPARGADPQLLRLVFQHYADDPEFMKDNCLIEVTPRGEFLTYGVGIPLMQMRHPEQAHGRAPVAVDD